MWSLLCRLSSLFSYFFFNVSPTTEIYTLSLHDALPIYVLRRVQKRIDPPSPHSALLLVYVWQLELDRKSTRLNSSHANISYAVFCLKKKKKTTTKHKATNKTKQLESYATLHQPHHITQT